MDLGEVGGGVNMIKTHCINFSKKKNKRNISTFPSLAFLSPNLLLFSNICPNFMSSFSEFSFWVCFVFYFYLGMHVCLCLMHVQVSKRTLDSLEVTSRTDAKSAGNRNQVLREAVSALIPEPCPQSLPKSSCSSS